MQEQFRIGVPVRVNAPTEQLKAHFSGGLYIVAKYEQAAIDRGRLDFVCLYSVTNRCYVYAQEDWLTDISDEVLGAIR